MSDPSQIGKLLLVVALLIAATGMLLILFGRIPLFGNLPGDITIRGRSVTVFIPLATSLLLSLLLTILLNLLLRR